MVRLSADRSAIVAWSPSTQHPALLAAGTVAGAYDASFSSEAQLEIFGVDFNSPNGELPVRGALASEERFHRLAWGLHGISSGTYPYGLIAGGMHDGTINVWNPAAILEGNDEGALLWSQQEHTGPVRGLEFNPFHHHLLASGGDSKVLLCDLTNPEEPSLYSPGESSGEIRCLAWNRKVQHILASTGSTGTTVVWDLKQKRPVISFSDSSDKNRSNSALAWNPDNATQLIVASDDDRHPILQVWDLRNAYSPMKSFSGHTKGILAVSWCPSDSGLVLTCGKDNRTICWAADSNDSEILCELPSSNNWNFDVQWSPCIPAVLSTSSFDGHLYVNSLQDVSAKSQPNTPSHSDFLPGVTLPQQPKGPIFKRAPKWLKRPVGVSFDFSGRLYVHRSGAKQTVEMHSLASEPELIQRSEEFEKVMASGEFQAFCDTKIANSTAADETEVWEYMKILFAEDARRKILDRLGFQAPTTQEAFPEALSPAIKPAAAPEPKAVVTMDPNFSADDIFSSEGGDDFLSGLQQVNKKEDGSESPAEDVKETPAEASETTAETAETTQATETTTPAADATASDEAPAAPATSAEPEIAAASSAVAYHRPAELVPCTQQEEESLQNHLVIGDFKSAVDQCMKSGRWAEALFLASHADPATNLWNFTKSKFLSLSSSSFLKVFGSVLNKDLMGYVQSASTESWKQTLAVLCTYAPPKQFSEYCGCLAKRLEESGMTHAAIICYMCAGDIDACAALWAKTSIHKSPFLMLQDVIEKVAVLRQAVGTTSVSESTAEYYCKYAALLSCQGRLDAALRFLDLIGSKSSQGEVLRDRIQHHASAASGSFYEHYSINSSVPILSAVPDARGSAVAPKAAATAAAPVPAAAAAAAAAPSAMGMGMGMGAMAQQQQQQQHQAAQPASYYPYQTQQYGQPQQQAQGYGQQQQQQGYGYGANVMAQQTQQPVQQPVQQQPQAVAPATAAQGYSPYAQYSAYGAAPNVGIQTTGVVGGGARPAVAATAQPVQTMKPVGAAPAAAPSAASSVPASSAGANINMDTSSAPADLQPIISTLRALFEQCSNACRSEMDKRKMQDVSKKLALLFTRLVVRDISESAINKLHAIRQAIEAGDLGMALQYQVALTTEDWDENSQWIVAIKRLIDTAKK
eukprot:TRINITY_DN1665_c0_g1::TRINITY_DN1665_c0_g1_i1::g.17806::m.17806 TRINITY_DN1665_c0_g1::TRINITY_DN1665_c0_g1_i1::g.17806  ORF type:complete len:1147 (-),score=366.04,sp/Q8L611/SC31B_ARATH/34.52/0.0,WD40/PF00400.27/8.4,WD40/PF00400.27/0.0072,WD40/PF00400.27/0.11,WD40/PF00400.27/48,WD40/PF00400.27/3e-05,WD40/PF00400.27/31,Sec16_C/PF12931.2/5.7e-09,Sec16_C/PF12931.2/1.5e+02,SRA1/PF07304.6/6.9e-10,Med15/PF09606.5/0.15 TRINITY_DN1665_c0_g1_i1:221-3661(-)